MRMHSAFWWFAATCLLCAQAAAVGSPNLDARLDAIYLELGRGESPLAAQQCVDLVAQVAATDRNRARVLQAQLDVLTERVELNKPPGSTLHDAIAAYAALDPHARSLSERFAIMQTLDHGDASAALQQAQASLTSVAAADKPELQAVLARAAAQVPGQLPLAREQAELALAAWQARRGAQAHWHEVELYYIIGSVYEYTGSKTEALLRLQAGVKIAIDSFGANSVARFRLDTDRAAVLGNMGRHREAIEIRESMLAAARARYGEHSIEVAKSEGLLGASLQEIGDYAAARAHYAQAQAVVATLTDAPAHDRGVILANYGNLLQEMGEEQAALDQYSQALTLWGDGETTMHARAVVSANMGNTEFRLQHYEAAIVDFKRALALREQSDGKQSPGLAYALEGLGSASLGLKRYADAETSFRRALDLRGHEFAPNHPAIEPLRFGLALSRWGQGDEAEAFGLAVQTAENQQGMLTTFAADFSERQSVAYRELLTPATALAVTLAARRGDADSIAKAWHLAAVERGLVARTQAHRLAAARAQSDPELAKAWAGWREANSALGEAWMAKSVDGGQMATLRANAERAERALWSHAGQYDASISQTAVSISDLAHSLPADGLLIAYTEGVGGDPAALLTAGDKPVPEDWYAFALGADAKPQLHRVGNVQSLTAQARAWYLDLRNPASDVVRLRSSGEQLRQALLDPLLTAGHAQRLFIVPEGELYRLSFAALPDRDHGYLIERGVRVHTLANESDLALPAATAGTATLLAGAPMFAAAKTDASTASRQLCLRAAREGFAAIPNAGRELDDLNTLLSATSATPQIKMVRGAEATKQNVLNALPQANIVHLATHGFSLDDSCEDAAGSRGVILDRAPSAEGGAAQESVLSGLAFTGASVVTGQAPIGVLSAGELATLDLSHVAWIALSACDSGLGPIGRNEGVFGMRRALRLAGARTVVMSLWQVDDAATADLMESLYRARFVEHADVPDAIATAMASVIAARRAAGQSDHPYYWAAFIGEGGWH